MSFSTIFYYFIDAFLIIKNAKLKKYYFFPGIIATLLFIFFIWLGELGSFHLIDILDKFFQIKKYGLILSFIIKLIVYFLVIIIYFTLYKSILLLILSPILSYLSEKIETYLTKEKFEFSIKKNIIYIFRGIKIGVKTFFKEMVGTIIILLLSFIFPINFLVPFLIFLLQSYFTGFAFMDYVLERHNFTSTESFLFLKNQRFIAISIGCIFMFLFLIPIIGIFIAPIITCVASTKITLSLIENNKKGLE